MLRRRVVCGTWDRVDARRACAGLDSAAGWASYRARFAERVARENGTGTTLASYTELSYTIKGGAPADSKQTHASTRAHDHAPCVRRLLQRSSHIPVAPKEGGIS